MKPFLILQLRPEDTTADSVLTGHKEARDVVPPAAVLLARNDDCPVQMFRVGQNVYATQFHPEAQWLLKRFANRYRTADTVGVRA